MEGSQSKSIDILALFTSLLALGVAAYSIYLTTRAPEVLLQMPNKVRVMQATQNDEAELYLHPNFINTGKNDRGDVIHSITLLVTYLPTGQAEERKYRFVTDSYGEWDFSQEEYDLEYFRQDSYTIVSDPDPLVLRPASSENPVVLFEAGKKGFSFQPGIYQLTITASRASKSAPLEETIDIELTQTYIDLLNARGDRGVIGQVVPRSGS